MYETQHKNFLSRRITNKIEVMNVNKAVYLLGLLLLVIGLLSWGYITDGRFWVYIDEPQSKIIFTAISCFISVMGGILAVIGIILDKE